MDSEHDEQHPSLALDIEISAEDLYEAHLNEVDPSLESDSSFEEPKEPEEHVDDELDPEQEELERLIEANHPDLPVQYRWCIYERRFVERCFFIGGMCISHNRSIYQCYILHNFHGHHDEIFQGFAWDLQSMLRQGLIQREPTYLLD